MESQNEILEEMQEIQNKMIVNNSILEASIETKRNKACKTLYKENEVLHAKYETLESQLINPIENLKKDTLVEVLACVCAILFFVIVLYFII